MQLEALSEQELLALRIRDLPLAIEGSELEPRVAQLYAELSGKGIAARPVCYLGDEWFSPEDRPLISVPFYLAHPRLKALEQKMMMEVEGGDPKSCQKLLRHECGHAVEHAYRLHLRKGRKELFGPRGGYDPDRYRPQPYSKSHVRHLPNFYAQAHPDEDFAETFAVWLDPETDWRAQYRGWKALEKLEYVDRVMQEIAGRPPAVKGGAREYAARRMGITLETFYRRRRKLYAADLPDVFDPDLRRLFSSDGASRAGAAAFLMRRRKRMIDSVARWTGERKITIEILLKRLAERAAALSLPAGKEETGLALEVAAYLATLVTNYRLTGKFKRTP